MKSMIKTALLAGLLLVSGSAFAAQVSIGITIGPPPAPRVVRIVPQRPSPEFVWIDGYWYVAKKHYTWHEGYWTRPPYSTARWVGPHHDGKMFFDGYWDGDRGRFEHDHHSDHDRDRDFHHKEGEHDRHDR
jgi:hypothetical protein